MREIFLLKSRIAAGGGAEKYAKRLAVAFHQKGCRVTLLTSGPLPKESYCEILSDRLASPFSFRRVAKFDRFCRRALRLLEAETVLGLDRNSYQTHLRASSGVHAAYLERRKTDCSLLKRASFPLNPLHRTLLKIEKRAFESPALRRLFVNSTMVKEEVLRYYRVEPEKIMVVHNGVEWEEMQGPFALWEQERPALLQKLQLPQDRFHLLFIGHNYRRKGLIPLLRGLAALGNRAPLHLSVVGRDKKRPYFEQLASALGVKEQVSFFTPRENLLAFYQIADALAIPSLYDPFANVTLEALAMGLFVISSVYNGGAEILEEKTGCVIDDLYDPESVAAALKCALAHPKSSGSASHIRQAVRSFDFSLQLEQLVDETLR